MNYRYLTTEIDNHLAIVTINRPDKLNALNNEVVEELTQCFTQLQTMPAVRCAVLTGAGNRAFAAGADIAEFQGLTPDQATKMSLRGQALMRAIEHGRLPVIAAINGFALGGGLELAMACHIRLAADGAKMGLPEVGLGLIPGYGGTQRLAQLIGKGRAAQMMASAEMIDAAKATAFGLVNSTHSAEELLPAARALAAKISTNSPTAVSAALQSMQHLFEPNAYQLEAELFGNLFAGADVAEGTTAFLEKRKPNFNGA